MATKVKTLRLPEDVCQTVESFPGENFTEKFVAAARLLGRDRERLIKENAILEEKRKQQYVKLCDMDKLLRKIGLSGRSIVPVLIGFGCCASATTSSAGWRKLVGGCPMWSILAGP